MNLRLTYMKCSKTMAYLIAIAKDLLGTADQDNPQRFLARIRIVRFGGGYKMVATVLSRGGVHQENRGCTTLILDGNECQPQVTTGTAYDLMADWRLLGNPIWCEALVDDNRS